MLLRNNNPALLEPGFKEIFDDAFNEVPMVFPRIFNVMDSQKQDEKFSGMTGFGQLDETGEGEQIVYEDPNMMYDVTFVHKKFTKGFKVSEENMEDDLYNIIKNKPADLGRAARRTAENSAANVLNRGWNTSYPGGDAKPLFSTIHPRSDGGSSQSNASGTGITLTDENLHTGELAVMQQLDDKGQIIQVMPRRIVVPLDLVKDAEIITGSDGRSGSADNDKNVYKGKYDVVGWEYLTLNNTHWMLQDPSQHKLTFLWRVRPEFKNDAAFDAGMALFKVRARWSNGHIDWRGMWGSLGDGAAYSS